MGKMLIGFAAGLTACALIIALGAALIFGGAVNWIAFAAGFVVCLDLARWSTPPARAPRAINRS